MPPSVTTTLDAAITTAQTLVSANDPEGTIPGQHSSGALATLSGALATAQAVTSADAQATVDAAAAALTTAISDYNAALVPLSTMTAHDTAVTTAQNLISTGAAE